MIIAWAGLVAACHFNLRTGRRSRPNLRVQHDAIVFPFPRTACQGIACGRAQMLKIDESIRQMRIAALRYSQPRGAYDALGRITHVEQPEFSAVEPAAIPIRDAKPQCPAQ